MRGLELANVGKAFDDAFAIRDVSLNVEPGELACLLGPSGCGKSTLLRLIAGLEDLDAGSVFYDGVDLHAAEPHTRGFGLMFQDLALFPHMDVLGNIGFGLRMQHLTRSAINVRVNELLALVDLAGYAKRKVHELSGGERQRVALARSLAPSPKLLMLDEPLGSLDRVLRESLQTQIRAILKQVGVTAIYVTHDRDEAFAIADTIVIMEGGAIVQAGAPDALFAAPANELVARSLGIRNILSGTVGAGGDGPKDSGLTVTCALGVIPTSGPAPASADGQVLVVIDERGIVVGPADGVAPAAGALLSGMVNARSFHGGEQELRIAVGDSELVCVVPSHEGIAAVGASVEVAIPREAVRLVPASAAR